MNLENARVAVTGSTGFLGSHITLALQESTAQAVAVVRSRSKARWLADRGVEIARADLLDAESLRRAFSGCDAVVANAGLLGRRSRNLQEFIAGNVRGVENLMTAAAEAGVRRVILISSVAVYRTSLFTLVDETHPTHTSMKRPWDISALVLKWYYSVSKARGEQVAREMAGARGIDLTALRPGPIYGERDGGLTSRYARAMRRRVYCAPTAKLSFVHGGDVAAAVIGALRNDASAGRAYNVTGDRISPWQLLRTWKRVAGGGPLLVPLWVPLGITYDDRAARCELGFNPRSFEQGILGLLRPAEPGAPANVCPSDRAAAGRDVSVHRG